MDIVIDTVGQIDLAQISSESETEESESESEDDCVPENFAVSYKTSLEADIRRNNPKEDDVDFEKDTYLDIHIGIGNRTRPVNMEKRHTSLVQDILKKSVIGPGFEKLDAAPPYEESKRRLIKKRREERAKSKGKEWFNLPAPDVTEEMKNDLEILQMRSVLDPKQFYKKNDLKVLPKYFQVGRIVETPADFYHSRIPKKQRKKTIVEELMADAEFKRYNKRKYQEIIASKKFKGHSKAHKHSKKLKKKNK